MSVTNSSSAAGLKQKLVNSSSLLEALDAPTKWQAFVLLSATSIASLIAMAVFGAVTAYLSMQSQYLGAFSAFITFVVVFSIALIGVNATGIMLADEVWGRQQRGIMDAILASVFSCHRLIALFFIELLLFMAFLVVLTFLLFLCKIPGIGPVLYAVVFPLGAISTGIVVFALLYIAIPLAYPAVWNGTGIKRSLVMLQEVARTRLLTAVVMMVLLGLLITFVVGFVWMILIIGTGTVVSLSTVVLGSSAGNMNNLMGMLMSGGGNDGYHYALGFGAAILALMGANPGILIGIKGSSIIYREVTADLSLEAAEAGMDRRMQELKDRAEQARQRAAASMAQAPAAPLTPLPVVATPVCPACAEPIVPDDVFCGGCGHKLK